jgi:hypothetical protein
MQGLEGGDPMRRASIASGILGLVAALACATPASEHEVAARLHRVAAATPELGQRPRVVSLYADSKMAAWAQATEATAEGPSGNSRALAQAFESAARHRVAYAVGGPYATLNDRTLLDAFDLVRAQKLPGLILLLVSDRPPSEALRSAARQHGARLLYRPYSS